MLVGHRAEGDGTGSNINLNKAALSRTKAIGEMDPAKLVQTFSRPLSNRSVVATTPASRYWEKHRATGDGSS